MRDSGIKISDKSFYKIFLIVFLLIIPAVLVVFVTLYSVYSQNSSSSQAPDKIFTSQNPSEEEYLLPSQIIENKSTYLNKRLKIRGKISMEPIVCEKISCPSQDSCCGCNIERNLIIFDPKTIAIGEGSRELRLVGLKGETLCRRIEGSCKYDCPGWDLSGIYGINGVFLAELPPKGSTWSMYFNMRFLAEESKLVSKNELSNLPNRIIEGIRELIGSITKSGYKVLP